MQASKVYKGNRVITPLFLNASAVWSWVASCVNRPFYPAGKLSAIPDLLGRSVGHTACPGRFREEENKVKYVAYSGNRPASNVVTVLTELSCFRLLWVPAVRRTSGDVTNRYRKMFKVCTNVGLSLHSSCHQRRSFVIADSIADSWTSHQTELKSLNFGYTRG
jgi:hypothetical protein